jgi:uncharacterized protein YfiM (DUF2279 family)
MKFSFLSNLLYFLCQFSLAQSTIENFLKPADSLDIQRRNSVIISQAAIATTTFIGLNELWYKEYPKSNFHTINDNAEWLQMDKAGHVFSAYHLSKASNDALAWSGVSKKNQLLFGATSGFLMISAIEVLDGYSSKWGASVGDLLANASGTTLYVSQELVWKEQRIVPKFSFHTTPYASARPNVLGSSVTEQVFKDYNGQTYWLSVNIHSFLKGSKIPKWLNLAVGYGAEGMITGNDSFTNTIFLPESKRARQYYLSFDVDLTKIETKSHVLKTIFSIFNTVKIPSPTIEFKHFNDVKWHLIYF